MPVTLLLTRTPLNPFQHHAWDKRTQKHILQSGRFGELIVVKGPKVTDARKISSGASVDSSGTGISTVQTNNGIVQLVTNGGAIDEVKRYTTIERYLQDSSPMSVARPDPTKGFVQLSPNKSKIHPKPVPYWVTYETNNSAVKELPGADGQCFRVHGGQSSAERGILIHEAPHVGWVIGCISPRPLNNFLLDFKDSPSPSRKVMEELFRFVGKHSRADFFVLDW